MIEQTPWCSHTISDPGLDVSRYCQDAGGPLIRSFSPQSADRGWRDGSAVQSTGCSPRGPEFNFQQAHGGLQSSMSLAPSSGMLVYIQKSTHTLNKKDWRWNSRGQA